MLVDVGYEHGQRNVLSWVVLLFSGNGLEGGWEREDVLRWPVVD